MKKDYIESCGTCANHPTRIGRDPDLWCDGRGCTKACILQSSVNTTLNNPTGKRYTADRVPELIQFLKIEV